MDRLNRIVQQILPIHAAADDVTSRRSTSISGSNCTGDASGAEQFKFVKVERQGRVGIVTLNRPDSLNALSDALISDLARAITMFNKDDGVGCIVMTGAGRAFAAGADIKEMTSASFYQMSQHDKLEPWSAISGSKLPIVAAVNGIAFGGGCEIAMMCDIIVASENAQFGQPEIKIGTIPGAGGTIRLTHAIGKSKAMEMVLTGKTISASEAERAGLVAAVVPADQLMTRAMSTANAIASLSRPVVILAKESTNTAFEASLREATHMERRLFHSTFALADQSEGMSAFVNKRRPQWQHK